MGQLCIFLNISKFPLENIFFGKYSISRLLFQCFTKTKKRYFMKKFLLLLCLAAVFPLLAYPLVPGKRYRADFEMKTIHPAYPEDWYCQNLKFNYPGVSFRFANSKGKELRRLNFKSPYYMSFFNNFNKNVFVGNICKIDVILLCKFLLLTVYFDVSYIIFRKLFAKVDYALIKLDKMLHFRTPFVKIKN